MEFLKISENKLKVNMTKNDMQRYGIDENAVESDGQKIRAAFWRVLDAARDECGFDASGNKLLIQYYPSAQGSELFVTKLGKIGAAAQRNISKSQNVTMLSSNKRVYKFATVTPVAMALRGISEEGKSVLSDLYFCDDGYYYLTFEERTYCSPLTEFSRMSEYAVEVPSTLLPYIIEHSKRVTEKADAIRMLSEL